MSPVCPRILAASTSLIPNTLVRLVPEAATAAAQRRRFSPQGPVEASEVGYELASHRLALEVRGTLRADRAKEPRRHRRREPDRRTARAQIAKQPMKPVDHPPALCGELVPAVGQQSEHTGVVLGSHPTQIRAALGHRGHGLRVDPVGLPTVASVELPRPCGKHRRDVDHDLAGGDELLGEQVAEAVRALDGPGPLGPVLRP